MRPFLLLIIVCFGYSLSAQVNLQTGSATYSIPLFSFSDSKTGLSTQITLSYSSRNGLSITDRASNTGQYWSLVAGGSIVRKQNGEPDDQNSTSLFPVIPNANVRGFNENIAVYDEDYQSFSYSGDPYSRNYIDNYFPNGYMYSEFALDMTEDYPLKHLAPKELALLPRFKSNMDKKWKLSRRALTDRQQDVFTYNFNGVSGDFVIGRDGNILLINETKKIIEKTTADMTGSTPYSIRTRINGFTIKDDNGLIYKFNSYELSEVMKYTEISNTGSTSFRKIISSGVPTGKYTIQKWLLTEIENPITHEKIIFEYEDYSVDFITDKTPTYQNTEGQVTESVQIHEQRASGKLKRLKNIILPDGHKVELFYIATPNRIDIPNDLPLSQIKVSYNNEVIYSYIFKYGYFLKKEIKNYTDVISENDKRFARLCLTSLQKTGGFVSEPAYKFSYYTGSESAYANDLVPSFDCMAQDHWGYYNPPSNVDINDPNPTKEVLKDLILHYYTWRLPSPDVAKFGLLKSVQNPFGGKITFEYEQNESKDTDNPSATQVTGGVRVFKTTISDGANTASDIITTYNYKIADGSSSGWGFESPTYLNRREIKIWNASTTDGYTQQGAVVFDITTALAKFMTKEAANLALKETIKAGVKAAEAAGVTVAPMPEPVSIIAAIVIDGLIDRIFVLFNPTDYIWSNTYNFYPFQSKNPIGVNYSRVEVVNTSYAGGTGKTIYEFTAPANVRTEIPVLEMPYAPKQRFPGWKYGLPLRTLIYNQSSTSPVKEIINTYSIFSSPVINNNHKSSKVEVVRPESASCWAFTYNIPITDFSYEFYYPITGRAELVSTVEKNYSPAGVLSESQVIATFNSDFLENTSTSTKSTGDQVIIKNYYPNNYGNISTAIQDMKTLNMISTPISSEVWLRKPNADEFLIDATINEFIKLPDNQIKLKKIYKLETKEPLIKSIIGEQGSNALVRNTTYFKEQLTFDYNEIGVLVQSTNRGGQISSDIVDYNNRFIIATVTNASANHIAYSSFESDGKGNWQYDISTINYNDQEWMTGKRAYKLNNGTTSNVITKNNLDPLKTYLVSYWAKNGSVAVNGVSTSAIYSAAGWDLFIHEVNGASTISVSGTALIDEARLYPKGSLMSTTTYQPSIGKTSECDPNNRIVYYEYDDLKRLRIIRDDSRKVIKMYEYNYKQN